MKKKNSTRDNMNLFFSAFLIVAYLVCAYFFASSASVLKGSLQALVYGAIFAVFGALLFYATRVGDGKPVKRFSFLTLILMVLPSLYAILAFAFPVIPLHTFLVANPTTVYLAGVAFGYGIPYTFISGFELVEEEFVEEAVGEEAQVVEGGIEEDLMDTEATEEETVEEIEDEIVVEGVASVEAETAEETEEAPEE